jgi:hypothetical protein
MRFASMAFCTGCPEEKNIQKCYNIVYSIKDKSAVFTLAVLLIMTYLSDIKYYGLTIYNMKSIHETY